MIKIMRTNSMMILSVVVSIILLISVMSCYKSDDIAGKNAQNIENSDSIGYGEAFRLRQEGKFEEARKLYEGILESSDDLIMKIKCGNELAAMMENENGPYLAVQCYERVIQDCKKQLDVVSNLETSEAIQKRDTAKFFYIYSLRRVYELTAYSSKNERLEQAKKYYNAVSSLTDLEEVKLAAQNVASATTFLEPEYYGHRTELSVALEMYINDLLSLGRVDEAAVLIPKLAEYTQNLQQEFDLNLDLIHRRLGSKYDKQTAIDQVTELMANRKHEKINCAGAYATLIIWNAFDWEFSRLTDMFDTMCDNCVLEPRTEYWFYQALRAMYANKKSSEFLDKYETVIPSVVEKVRSEIRE